MGVTFQKPAQFHYHSAGAAHHSQQPRRYTLTVCGWLLIVCVIGLESFKSLIVFFFISAVMIPAYTLNRGYSIFFIAFSVIGKLTELTVIVVLLLKHNKCV